MSSIQDDWLERSVAEVKLAHPQIAFQSDDQPCRHAKATARALARTVGRNYLTGISGYEFVRIVNGNEFFTVERFKVRSLSDLQSLGEALANNRPPRLKVQSNTSYDHFLAGDSLVIMISSANGHEDHSSMFARVQQLFLSFSGSASPQQAR